MGQNEARFWRAGVAALGASMSLGACILPDIDLEGRACPCTEGYSCDAADTCVKGDVANGSSSIASSVASAGEGGGPPDTSSGSAKSSSAGDGGAGGDGDGGGGGATGGEGGGGGLATTSSGTGGAGGGEGGCSPDQTTDVPMCGDFFDTFDDPVSFVEDWTFAGAATAFDVEDSRFTITMAAASPLAAFAPGFDMVGCAITIRLLGVPDAADIYGRLSIGPQGAPSGWTMGVIEGTLQVRDGSSVVSATTYDPLVHRYLRIREEDGSLVFGTSADGVCWDEAVDIVGDDTMGVNARLALSSDGAPAVATVVFDDYNVLP